MFHGLGRRSVLISARVFILYELYELYELYNINLHSRSCQCQRGRSAPNTLSAKKHVFTLKWRTRDLTDMYVFQVHVDSIPTI